MSLSTGLRTMALPEGFSRLPTFRGVGKMIANLIAIQGYSLAVASKNMVYDKALFMSAEFYSKVAELAAQRKYFAVATIVRVEGSSSAKPGSKAIIDEQGKIAPGMGRRRLRGEHGQKRSPEMHRRWASPS